MALFARAVYRLLRTATERFRKVPAAEMKRHALMLIAFAAVWLLLAMALAFMLQRLAHWVAP
jgi:hypothetical protein